MARIIFSLLFLPTLLWGQITNHFGHLDSKWNVAKTFPAANQQNPDFAATLTTVYGYQGDSIINNQVWFKMYSTDDSSFQNNLVYRGLTRTENNKVLFIDTLNQLDTLYNFDLNVGDSVQFNLYNSNPEKIPIIEIDSVELNGQFYKRIKFAEPDITAFDKLNEVWIEGIGSIHGPLFPHYPVKFSEEMPDSMLLICSTSNNQHFWEHPSYSSCYVNIVLGSDTEELMKIRDVFDFEIGDKFQFRSMGTTILGTPIPPNADRISIIGKFISAGQDSLFYIQSHDSYNAELVMTGDPHLEYHFWTKTDTAVFVDPDSSIAYYDAGFLINQYIQHSATLCESLINGCNFDIGSDFENDLINNEYGKGLGSTYAYFYDGQGRYHTEYKLFYYNKGGIGCGTPDLTTVGLDVLLKESTDFSIYPNPFSETVFLKNKSNEDNFQCRLLNPMGQSIMTMKMHGEINYIDLSFLKSGIYYLTINSAHLTRTLKLIKK